MSSGQGSLKLDDLDTRTEDTASLQDSNIGISVHPSGGECDGLAARLPADSSSPKTWFILFKKLQFTRCAVVDGWIIRNETCQRVGGVFFFSYHSSFHQWIQLTESQRCCWPHLHPPLTPKLGRALWPLQVSLKFLITRLLFSWTHHIYYTELIMCFYCWWCLNVLLFYFIIIILIVKN